MNKRVQFTILLIASVLLVPAFLLKNCQSPTANKRPEKEVFYLYTSKDTLVSDGNYYKTVPKVDRTIQLPKSMSIREKLNHIADSLSLNYFNGLKIAVSLPAESNTVHINLLEKPAYDGPGSLPPYESWYDFFQGSSGGQTTTIVLKTSFLQPNYEGTWIDGLLFFYEGDSIGQWSHLNLSGMIKRRQ